MRVCVGGREPNGRLGWIIRSHPDVESSGPRAARVAARRRRSSSPTVSQPRRGGNKTCLFREHAENCSEDRERTESQLVVSKPSLRSSLDVLSTIEMTPPSVSPALPPNEVLLIGEDERKLALDGEDGSRNVDDDGEDGDGKPDEEASERYVLCDFVASSLEMVYDSVDAGGTE